MAIRVISTAETDRREATLALQSSSLPEAGGCEEAHKDRQASPGDKEGGNEGEKRSLAHQKRVKWK